MFPSSLATAENGKGGGIYGLKNASKTRRFATASKLVSSMLAACSNCATAQMSP